MIKVFIYFIVLLLALLGLTDILHFIVCRFLIDKNEIKECKLIVLQEENATRILRYLIFKKKWYGKYFNKKIIAVTDNLSEETVTRCFEASLGCGIILVPSCVLKNVLNSVF